VAPPIRYARSGDVHIAHQLVGDGPDDLVYAWGLISNLEMMWEDVRCADFIQRLARFRRLLLFDRRGQGMSDRIASAASVEDHVDDLVAVMDAAGAARASIFGESNGVAAAIGCAALHPERVDRLVLFHGTAKMLADTSQPWAVSEEVLESFAGWAEERWGTGRMLRGMAPSEHIDLAGIEFAARYERQSHSPASFVAALRAEAHWDVRPLLERITAPTLVLHRRDNPVTPLGHAELLAERIRGAELVVLDGSAQVPQLGDADRVAEEIERFMTGSAAASTRRVLGTIVFTDLVGSTDRAAELGDERWRLLLDRYEATARIAVLGQGGREIKTTGDGFLFVFDLPSHALAGAHALLAAASSVDLEARVGVHSGEYELRDNDVGGIAIAIASRVNSLAGPGEVLTTTTVRDLSVGAPFDYHARGTHSLKGVPGTWPLLAVTERIR
jgi:pimeloyl-ACP methyl ester carboxylesterase